jgi:hypothetical protein
MLIAPVKNENSEVILFILNFEELSEGFENKFAQGLKTIEIQFLFLFIIICKRFKK